MKKKRAMAVAAIVCILTIAVALPVLAVDIESLVDLFVTDISTGMAQISALAATDPDAVALVLAGVAERIAELQATDPGRASSLEGALQLCCIDLIDDYPECAALVVATVKDRVPDIGERFEAVVVASGLEEDYLRAASPVRP